MAAGAPPATHRPGSDRPSVLAQLRVWLSIGLQSFGGGATTLYLMRREFIHRRGWLTAAEFRQEWMMSRIAPGMTIVGLSALLGQRLGGPGGIVIAVAGLLLPATATTLLVAVGFLAIAAHPLVGLALSGMGPVTVGLTAGIMLTILTGGSVGGPRVGIEIGVAVLAGLAALLFGLNPVPVLVAGGIIGALTLTPGPTEPVDAPETPDRDLVT